MGQESYVKPKHVKITDDEVAMINALEAQINKIKDKKLAPLYAEISAIHGEEINPLRRQIENIRTGAYRDKGNKAPQKLRSPLEFIKGLFTSREQTGTVDTSKIDRSRK
ncbi:MAG: hypothetical protein FWE16_03620 [Firmicutes bacterium]|nr:hypothetical protein [Bacillota bacterium]